MAYVGTFSQTDTDTLEGLLDQYGMQRIMDALSGIAFEKAEHVRENWQDEPLAKDWEAVAKAIDRFSNTKAIEASPL